MLITRQGSQIFIPTFPLSTSIGAAAGAMVFWSSGASAAFTLSALGLAGLFAVLTVARFMQVRRVDDRLLVRRGLKHLDVLVEGTALKRIFRPYLESQGPRAALVLQRREQSEIELVEISGFTPDGVLRSAQAIGDSIATYLGIPYARELSDMEARVGAKSRRDVRFVVIALAVLFVGLGGIYAMLHLGPGALP